MLFVTVLLMNMLIAMMANTYQNVSVTTSLKLQKKKSYVRQCSLIGIL